MNYWETRARQNERKAAKTASTAIRREKTAYKAAYKAIEADLNALLLDIGVGLPVSRTDLWRAGKYLKLRQTIEQRANILADNQIGLLDRLLKEVFEDTLEISMDDFLTSKDNYNVISKQLIERALNTAWSGENYSMRVWQNRNKLAQKLNKSVADMIILGKNPTDIKRQIVEEFDVSYRMADRLVRTEASHIYNTAAIESYKAAGIKQVKYLHGGRCSEKCRCCELAGKIFDIGTEPVIPQHPNCVCCYAPVVEEIAAGKN